MKANEYFKKHGYRKCKSACAENGWLNTGFWIQLKRLVESHELVESEGGLTNLRKAFEIERGCGGVQMTPIGERLFQAIADVESCQ